MSCTSAKRGMQDPHRKNFKGSVLPSVACDNIEIEEATEGRLVGSNKQLVWREFGITL